MFRDLGPVRREVYFTELINELSDTYKKATTKLKSRLANIDFNNFKKGRTDEILLQVNAISAGLNKPAKKWAQKAIPQGYERGVDFAGRRLKMMGVTSTIKYDSLINTSAVNVLADDVAMQLIQANQSMKRSIGMYIRRTQQTLLQDKEISKMIASGIVTGDPRRATQDKILAALHQRMGKGKFVVINNRNYDPSAYARLLARTRTREATSQGSINTALRYDVDLQQVSAHAGACAYCLEFQGRVYSISGNTSGFPMLDEFPPYHPNCEHVIVPVTQDFLRRRYGKDGYDNLKKLSQTPKMPSNIERDILRKHTNKDFTTWKKKYNLIESHQEYTDFIKTGRVSA